MLYDIDSLDLYDEVDPDVLACYGLVVDPAVVGALLDIEDARIGELVDLRLPPSTAHVVTETYEVWITPRVSVTRTRTLVVAGRPCNTTVHNTQEFQS